jgi:hypothetical protein
MERLKSQIWQKSNTCLKSPKIKPTATDIKIISEIHSVVQEYYSSIYVADSLYVADSFFLGIKAMIVVQSSIDFTDSEPFIKFIMFASCGQLLRGFGKKRYTVQRLCYRIVQLPGQPAPFTITTILLEGFFYF